MDVLKFFTVRLCPWDMHITGGRRRRRRVLFHETSQMRNFVEITPPRNVQITLSLSDAGKSCPRCYFLTWQICLLTLFTK